MTIRESMTGEFGDKMLVLCPTCSQRATGVTVYTAFHHIPVGIVLTATRGASVAVMRPCGHAVEEYTYRILTEVRDATAQDAPRPVPAPPRALPSGG